jgi:hypothetical protein
MMTGRKKLVARMILVLLALVLCAQPALAAPNLDYSAINNDWWDERGNNICGSGSAGDGKVVNSEDNEKTIFFSLLANGFSKLEAAAVLGNLQQESTFNPKAQEPGGKGRGIVQWSEPGRWRNAGNAKDPNTLVGFANGRDIWALETQIQFIFHEIKNVPQFQRAFIHFKSLPSTQDNLLQKVLIWANEYEIAGIIGPRYTNALNVQQQDWYKSAPEPSGTDTGGGASTGGGSSCSSTGGGSQYIDGFVVYSQTDPRWNNHPYGQTRIGPGGCGPTAMAMIVTNLTGKSVLPPEVADYAASHGQFVHILGGKVCDCSSWGIGPAVAKNYGLSSKPVGTNLNAINEALRAGALIIMSGSGPVPFTSDGHFIVIRAVTEDGKWLVGDSAHPAANTQKFDPQSILTHGNAWSAYAISK